MLRRGKRRLVILLFVLIAVLSFPLAAQAKIKLNKKKITITIDQKAKLKVKGTKKKATWKSSNPKVVSVNKKGEITAKAFGTAKITAKVAKKKLTCIVKVVCRHKHTETKNAVKETYTTEGYSGDVYCTDCGKMIYRGSTLPCLVCEHEHTETKNAVKETVFSDGYSGDVYCTTCGSLVQKGEVIKAPPIVVDRVEMVNPNCDISKTEAIIRFHIQYRYKPDQLIVWFNSEEHTNMSFSAVRSYDDKSSDDWYEVRINTSSVYTNYCSGYWRLWWFDAFDIYNNFVYIDDCATKYPSVRFYVPEK